MVQSHVYTNTKQNYVLQVTSQEEDGSSECAWLPIAFYQSPISENSAGKDVDSGVSSATIANNGASNEIKVLGAQPWTDTGIDLRAGETVSIRASGNIRFSAEIPSVGPDGDQPKCGTNPRVAYIAPELRCHSLIGRIGLSGAIFEVAVSRRFRATSAGRLYLGVNDNFFPDNSGNWTVQIATGASDTPSAERTIGPASEVSQVPPRLNRYHYVKIPTSTSPSGCIQQNLISTVPLGIFKTNNSLATPFDIPSTPNNCGYDGAASCNFYDAFGYQGEGQSITINVSIPHVTHVYTMMSAYGPAPGRQLATIEFVGSEGATDTFPLVAGENIRDYYQRRSVNGLANGVSRVKALEAFTCVDPDTCRGSGGTLNVNIGGKGIYVLDEQQFSLNSAFQTQDLVRIVITDTYNGSNPVLLGITTD
jgi:hypothetical protein